jgi:hypothetical protein
MTTTDLGTELFRRADSMDVEGWAAMMTDDEHFVFGNAAATALFS